MGKPLRVLMVEDSEDDVLLTVRALKKGGYDPEYERVETAESMRKALTEKAWDVILCDYQMPSFNGLAAIALLKGTGIDIPLIIVSGAIGEEMAVKCMQLGAHDYILKGNLSRLVPAIERELKESIIRREHQEAEESLQDRENELEAVYEEAPIIILLIDQDWRVRKANSLAARIMDRSLEELSGLRCGEALCCIHALDNPEGCGFGPNCQDCALRLMILETIEAGNPHDSVEISMQFSDGVKKQKMIFLVSTRRLVIKGQFLAIAILHDITDRKHAEEVLRETENRFRRISSLISDIAYSCSTKGDGNYSIDWMTGATERITGYSIEEMKAQCCWRFLVIEEDLALFEKDVTGLAPGSHGSCELRIRHKNGGIIWLASHAECVMRAEAPERFHLYGALVDITDRKRSEESLHSSEQRLSDIIEFLPDATLVIDKEGKVIAWNRAIEEMTGVKAADMLGKGDYEYALPFYGERRPILIDLALDPNPERDKSYTHIQRMGDILFGEAYTPGLIGGKTHLSATASVLRNPEGEIVAAIECIRDDTGRRKAQEDLRQAEERYRSIFENAQEGIYQSTPEGRIILANPAMAKMYGYASPEELMTSVTDVARQLYVDPEERATIRQIIEERTPVINHETQFYRKDGSTFWASLTMQAVRDEKGRVLYYEGIVEDITDRKQSVERMRKSLGATIQAMAVTVETRDPYTAGHQRRVADLARAIATEMNLSADQIDGIRMASVIHDLGKISVPAEILSKPTKLTNIEFSLIKTHAQSGYDILKDIDFPWPIARIVLEHHERMNGSGYPNGLTGDNILMESRIIAVADVVESMASHRPYRPSLGIEAALEEIEKNRGTHYDNTVVGACLRLIREKGFQLEGD